MTIGAGSEAKLSYNSGTEILFPIIIAALFRLLAPGLTLAASTAT